MWEQWFPVALFQPVPPKKLRVSTGTGEPGSVGAVTKPICTFAAGTAVFYSVTLINTGNVKLRGLQLVVPALSGSSTTGTVPCTDASGAWLTAPDLSPGGILVCNGSYSFSQPAIEQGSLYPTATATATNLLGAATADLPAISVPNVPSLSVNVDTSGCSKPSMAGVI